ncbi:uncharacterized protein LOC112680419 [Sipha flava]|uniref:Uncharacterized protein LOC112680419 n=1 Tax=Sipha flava TaxID=143950 RepID=A0A8B8F6C7_9HEMI|nr:uncharacterized protein LOC112680419 [Sipha flava]
MDTDKKLHGLLWEYVSQNTHLVEQVAFTVGGCIPEHRAHVVGKSADVLQSSESRINSVKVLRFQLSNILNALEEVSETANDLMARKVNIASKSLQDHNTDINTSVKIVQSLIQFLHQYRENGFNFAKIAAKKLAEDADIAVAFKNPRVRKKTKLFDYENVDEPVLNNEDRFLDEDTNTLQALNILKTTHGSFPNLTIALRIMLTIHVTSACAERSFSKLKLIKTYLRNRLGQGKLSELALISIEEEISSTIDYKHLIDIFASKKSRKKMFR